MQYQKKLDDIERRFEELTAQMADNAVISDSVLYRKISKQQSIWARWSQVSRWKTANRICRSSRHAGETDPELQTMARKRSRGWSLCSLSTSKTEGPDAPQDP